MKKVVWGLLIGLSIICLALIAFILNKPEVKTTETVEVNEQGSSLSLLEDSSANLNVKEKRYGMVVNEIKKDYSTDIIIEGLELNIRFNRTEQIDLDGDGILDITIKIESIDKGAQSVKIFIQETSGKACMENWQCSEWGSCSLGLQRRVCIDQNNCQAWKTLPEIEKSCYVYTKEFDTQNKTQETDQDEHNQTASGTACNDWSCMANAAETCSLANLTDDLSTELPVFGAFIESEEYRNAGIKVDARTFYEIYPTTNGSRCGLKLRPEQMTFSYNEEAIKMFQEVIGMTIEEIKENEEFYNEDYNLLEGLEGFCNFDKNDLFLLVTRWSEGAFSSTDFDAVECEGEYFEAVGTGYKEEFELEL